MQSNSRRPRQFNVGAVAFIEGSAVTKKIALFSDGTGNSSAKAQKTNVWRLFQAIDQTRDDQIAKYDDGVGTSSNKYLAALGGAFGWGLKRNVIDLYKFVCRNYAAGDQIYGFGFSRGAFTIRVLTGLIAREGLVVFRSEEELDRHASAAYRSFRCKAFPSRSPVVWVARKLRDFVLDLQHFVTGRGGYARIAAATTAAGRAVVPIRFLGLWDTVEAYGVPIAELKRAIDWALWPMVFGDMKLTLRVERAVHALALDDERTTFHPLLWDEVWEQQLAAAGEVKPGRITQVWFAGVHSNVGGGYPEDQLSLVPLEWIMREADKCGLSIDPVQAESMCAAKSPYARVYDSRAGIAAYYRYSPRQTPVFSYDGTPILSNVHWSVLLRMVFGSDSYAPITLPHTFNVMLPSGALVELQTLSQSLHNGITTSNLDLDAAISQLESPHRDDIGIVWDTVFWRTCLYVLTVLLTILTIAFPWFISLLPKKLATFDQVIGGPVSALVTAFSAVIPSYAVRWKAALTDYPLEFGLLLIGIALTLWGSHVLEGRIHDRSRRVWHRLSPDRIKSYRAWRDENRKGFRRVVYLLLAILIAIAIGVYVLSMDKSRARAMALGFAISAAFLAFAYALSVLGYREPSARASSRVRNTLALRVARAIRENPLLRSAYSSWRHAVAPTIFVLLIIGAGAVLLNRSAFDVMNSAGLWCGHAVQDAQENPAQSVDELGSATVSGFSTDRICWRTGLHLKGGRRYIIAIETFVPGSRHSHPGPRPNAPLVRSRRSD